MRGSTPDGSRRCKLAKENCLGPAPQKSLRATDRRSGDHFAAPAVVFAAEFPNASHDREHYTLDAVRSVGSLEAGKSRVTLGLRLVGVELLLDQVLPQRCGRGRVPKIRVVVDGIGFRQSVVVGRQALGDPATEDALQVIRGQVEKAEVRVPLRVVT